MIIWPTVSLWGGFMSISTMNFYVLKKPSISWKQHTKKQRQGFAENGVRESVQDNDVNVYPAISLSERPQKHTAPPRLWCSDNKLIRTQQIKFSSDIIVHSPAKVPTHSSLTFPMFTTFQFSLKFPFFLHESLENLHLKLGKSNTLHMFLYYYLYLIKEYRKNKIIPL